VLLPLAERSGKLSRFSIPTSYSAWVASANFLHALFVFNLGLQVWDGLATYLGMQLGVPEGNPLLRGWMGSWGVGWALVSAKTATCGLLCLLRCLEDLFLSRVALTFTAGLYFCLSFLPWASVLLVRISFP
jgi:hypothetical protein